MKRASRKKALELLKYWMDIYGLDGWIIKELKFMSTDQMKKFQPEANTMAIELNYSNKIAGVAIKKNISLFNLEMDTPHELGHVMMKNVDEAMDMIFEKYGVSKEDQAVCNDAQERVINNYRNRFVKYLKP